MAIDTNVNDINEKYFEFFTRNKKNIILLFILFLLIYFTFYFISTKSKQDLLIASDLYQKIQLNNELEKIELLVTELRENYKETPYASRSMILLGNKYQNNKDFLKAKESYIFAKNIAIEETIISLANYQLGLMLFTQKDYESALESTNLISSKGFLGLKYNLLGDIYTKQGKIDDAKEYFNKALDFYLNKNDIFKVIQLKLDAIS
jgi:predicted negative regulator of RcsB-dependent stress response